MKKLFLVLSAILLAGVRYKPGDKVELTPEEAEYFAKFGNISADAVAAERFTNTNAETAKRIKELEAELVNAAKTVSTLNEELDQKTKVIEELQSALLQAKEANQKMGAALKQSVSEAETAAADKTSAKATNKKA